MSLQSWVESRWYGRRGLFALLLAPLAQLFGVLAARRRRGQLQCAVRLPVPVVVVGNISVGGTGKTPLTIHLAQALSAQGWRPGIVSRGYGGTAKVPVRVRADSDPGYVGDEPVLLARASGVPVFVCHDRAAAGQALLAAHPAVNVILCDDGLQHYRLARDVEIAVIDGARGLGNGLLLPAGPLREPPSRLGGCQAVVINGASDTHWHARQHLMTLQPGDCYRLDAPDLRCRSADLPQPLTALCGIGNPQRFFATLRAEGAQFAERALADHHDFVPGDLPAGTLVVTEKDAVKLAAMPGLGTAGARIWVLPVRAALAPDLAAWLNEELHGRQTAGNSGLPGLQGPAGV
ncbi:tetraacyldisaccharide 4'-kinase [Chitinilyticum litopenaei]|uniref:tetraacyldisaccharide 4'-kinase n=1 Tax=Chitinilyticum litopenaei TaxID=1121276 RepID=UPI00042A87FD|nr:tetraacyldisaccharide 4'-kinase [Chitinilyticum litopenaei]